MGGFYTNYTLRGPTQEAVAEALHGRRATVTPPDHGCVVAFDEASDDQDQERIVHLANRLSLELNCPVLAVLDHDEDVLWYALSVAGEVMDEYNSTPGYFAPSGPQDPTGGDAKLLCRTFGVSDVAGVERILRNGDGYVFASERHADLVRALGLPAYSAGKAYASFERGEFPDGLTAGDMLPASTA